MRNEDNSACAPEPGGDAVTVFDEMVLAISELGVLSRSVTQGASVEAGDVTLILTGTVGLFAHNKKHLVSLAGPGDVIGLEAMAGIDPPLSGRWLTSGRVLQLPASALSGEGDHDQQLRWLAATSAARQMVLARGVACNLSHSLTARLANLLAVLTDNGRLSSISITQYELAQLLGVQRTTICAATEQLRSLGISKVMRGRIDIRDMVRLRETACGCRSQQVFEGQEHIGWFGNYGGSNAYGGHHTQA